MCFVKSGFFIGLFTPLLKNHVRERNFIRPGRVSERAYTRFFVQYSVTLEILYRKCWLWSLQKKMGQKQYTWQGF